MLFTPRMRMAANIGRGAFRVLGNVSRRVANRRKKRGKVRFPRVSKLLTGPNQISQMGMPAQISTTMQTQAAFSQTIGGMELIASIIGMPEGSFSHNHIPLDATNGLAWPRVAMIASQFEKFHVNSASLVYRPTVSTQSTGTVYLAFLPDATVPEPSTAEGMSGIVGCVQTTPWQAAQVECPAQYLNAITRWLFVREDPAYNNDPLGKDNLNNAGTLAYGMLHVDPEQEGQQIGSFHLRYSVTVAQPKVDVDYNLASGVLAFNRMTGLVSVGTSPLRFQPPDVFTKTKISAGSWLFFHAGLARPPLIAADNKWLTCKAINDKLFVYVVPHGRLILRVADIKMFLQFSHILYFSHRSKDILPWYSPNNLPPPPKLPTVPPPDITPVDDTLESFAATAASSTLYKHPKPPVD